MRRKKLGMDALLVDLALADTASETRGDLYLVRTTGWSIRGTVYVNATLKTTVHSVNEDGACLPVDQGD